MTSIDAYATFLTARWDEIEQVARGAMDMPSGCERVAQVGYSQVAPASDAADGAPLVPLGSWGWGGGPHVRGPGAQGEEWDKLEEIFGPFTEEPDRPYAIDDSSVWDESDEMGASYFRATVPASAGRDTARHIAMHDPAAALADLAAKRAILKDTTSLSAGLMDWASELGLHALSVVVHLATPFRDHPDHPANQEAQ